MFGFYKATMIGYDEFTRTVVVREVLTEPDAYCYYKLGEVWKTFSPCAALSLNGNRGAIFLPVSQLQSHGKIDPQSLEAVANQLAAKYPEVATPDTIKEFKNYKKELYSKLRRRNLLVFKSLKCLEKILGCFEVRPWSKEVNDFLRLYEGFVPLGTLPGGQLVLLCR